MLGIVVVTVFVRVEAVVRQVVVAAGLAVVGVASIS